MKQFMLFYLLLLPFCSRAQLTETFDGPALDSRNPWRVDSAGFYLSGGALCFDASGRDKGIHYIKTEIDYHHTMEWEFEVAFEYEPTSANHARAYVYGTALPSQELYYLQLGGLNRSVALYRFDAARNAELLIDSEKGLLADPPVSIRVRLTLEDESRWTLYTASAPGYSWTCAGSFDSPLHDIRSGGVFNFACLYQAKSKKNVITSFDNLYIRHQLSDLETINRPGEADDSSVYPALQQVQYITETELQLFFDQAVDKSDAVIHLSGIGDAYRISYADAALQTTLNAAFPTVMTIGNSYEISCSGLYTKAGGLIPDFSEWFELEREESGAAYPAGAVRINEIMADPKGLTALPETEYVELYNTAAEAINLNGWQFVYGGSAKTLPVAWLPAGGYAVLYRAGREIVMADGALDLGLANFPAALANAGKELQLLDPTGSVIDLVTYAKATAGRSWEFNGRGWQLSADTKGGTPGAVNATTSVTEPDNPEDPEIPETPQLIPEAEIEPGDIIFNELLPEPFSGGSEYIELYNRSGRALPLSGLSLALRKTDGSLATEYPLSAIGGVLEASGFRVVTKSAAGVFDFYTVPDPESIVEIPKLPILANTASTVVLFRSSDGVVIDEVSYRADWHAYFVKSAKGIALERIDTEGPTQMASNWTSALESAGYGTPGTKNSQYGLSESGLDTETGIGAPPVIEAPFWLELTGQYTIRYQLDKTGYACRIFIFNTSGQRVATLSEHEMLGLNGELYWDGLARHGGRMPAGVYIFFAELYHPDGSQQTFKKAFLMR